MVRRVALALVGVLLGLATLTACDDRECLKGHTEIVLMPVSTGKSVTVVPTSQYVCDEYAPEPANGG